jgi:hypothetical protein
MAMRYGSVPIPDRINAAAERRVAESALERMKAIRDIDAGRPLDAEPSERRKVDRLISVTGLPPAQATALAKYEISPEGIGLVGDSQ